MACTPLSIAVPLEGTDRELGVSQLERYVSQKPSIRSQYRRFRGPFLEYLTFDDLRRGPRDWKAFLQLDDCGERRQLQAYSIPGSVVALCERMDENLVSYTVNYLWVVAVATLVLLGAVRCCVVGTMGLSYIWLKYTDAYFATGWETVRQGALQLFYPFVSVLLSLLTTVGVRLVTGVLMGMTLCLLHAGSHRSLSEMRYMRQQPLIRWIRRRRAPLEGAHSLWRDVQIYGRDALNELHFWLRWRILHIRDVMGLLWLTLKLWYRAKGQKAKSMSVVKNS